jgi:predicted phosphate transport protein (TIGR00153 family)
MKERTNILAWLGMAEHDTVLRDAEKHIEETCKTVAYLVEAVKALVAGDVAAKSIAIENVRQSEREADKLRARMIRELSEGLLLPPDREDLLRFARALDKIADWTNSAARLMWFLDERLPENVLKQITIGTELIVAAVGKLREAIHAVSHEQVKEALSCCEDVERLEHQADDQKRHFIGAILQAQLSPANLLLCYNLAEGLEGITDQIETAADTIKTMAVKSR